MMRLLRRRPEAVRVRVMRSSDGSPLNETYWYGESHETGAIVKAFPHISRMLEGLGWVYEPDDGGVRVEMDVGEWTYRMDGRGMERRMKNGERTKQR